MKKPSIDMAKATDLLVRHGEKIVVAVVGLVGLMLLWGGIDAMRSLAVTDAQTPEAVNRAVTDARSHIGRDVQPPADLLPARTPLADAIDPWRTPLVPWQTGSGPWLTVASPPSLAVLDNPLFDELKKRDQPDVLPVEDLRAVAGVAVLPPLATQPEAKKSARPAAAPAGPGKRDPLAADRGGLPPDDGDAAPEQRGRIVPYVVVTGLIPAEKQQAEYRRRFEDCGYRDAKRDSPLWCDFEIDRATVGPDGKETWTTINLAAVDAKRAKDWGAAAGIAVTADFQLAAGEDARSAKTTPIGFVSPLPQRLDGTWDLADLHPWVVERARNGAEADRAAEPPPAAAPDRAVDRDGPGFGDAGQPAPAAPAAPVQEHKRLPEYRLFRFIDTAVEPGGAYRYRVRLKVWNPNFDTSPERMRPHLTDPALAREPKLTSPTSQPTAAAAVPDPTRVLVGTLRAREIKDLRLKPGMLEVLVLGASRRTGSFGLRGLVADPGAVLDVDNRLNLKGQQDRARGEDIVTKRILLDARGRQQDRLDADDDKRKPRVGIPEPLDVICLRPDGSFEVASLADSEAPIREYRDTLPTRGSKTDSKDAGEPDLPGGPGPVDPLARPGARP